MQEIYLLLFTDICFHNLFFMPENRLLLDSAILFNNFSKHHIWIIASFAHSFAQLLNFLIGKLTTLAIEEEHDEKELIKKISRFLESYSIILGVFNWLPIVGAATIVILGFKKVNFRKLFPSILIGNLIFYYIYTTL